MFFYHLSLLALFIVGSLLQQFLPPIPALHDARPLILPLIFLCGAVTVPTASMLLLAFAGGFLWDIQQILIHQGGDPSVYKEPSDGLQFGYSIALYALMGFLMQGIQPLFRQGKWLISAILTGIAIFFYLWVEYLLLSFIRGGFDFGNAILNQIIFTALLTMALSPFVFGILFKFARSFRYTINFDPLKRQRRSLS